MTSIEFWTAVSLLTITVILTSYGLYQQRLQAKRLGMMEISVNDTQGLRDAVRKPLEGVWDYRIDYSRFHGEEGDWQTNGKAVFLWRPANTSYDVYIGGEVTAEGKPNEALVAYFLQGKLDTDQSGWPEAGSVIDCKYAARRGSATCEQPSKPNFQYTSLELSKMPGGRVASSLLARFYTQKTQGTVEFRRLA